MYSETEISIVYMEKQPKKTKSKTKQTKKA